MKKLILWALICLCTKTVATEVIDTSHLRGPQERPLFEELRLRIRQNPYSGVLDLNFLMISLNDDEKTAFLQLITENPWPRELRLVENRIGKLPKGLGLCINLRILNLSHNNLDAVPATLCNLKSLKHLYLDHNRITSLPIEMGNLQSLEMLFLSNNQLQSVPLQLGSLPSLEYLNLAENDLSTLPSSFDNLYKLTTLLLWYNPKFKDQGRTRGQWGAEELKSRFGDKVAFDISTISQLTKIIFGAPKQTGQ